VEGLVWWWWVWYRPPLLFFYTCFCIAVFAVYDYCLEPSACMPVARMHIILECWYQQFFHFNWIRMRLTYFFFCSYRYMDLIKGTLEGSNCCWKDDINNKVWECGLHSSNWGARGSVMVEALCYKSEGRGIASRWDGFFSNLRNTSGRTMALGSTQPLTKMSTRNLKKKKWGVKGGRSVGLTTCCHLLAVGLRNVGASTSRNPRGLHGL
jgi:hypothetical protein